jgi:hypothetical protein
VPHQLRAPAAEREQAIAAARAAAIDCSNHPAERIEILAEAQEWAYRRAAELGRGASTVRIRKKAGPNLGDQYYSHAHRAKFAGGYRDPMAETLCGANATSYDMSWAETRYRKNRAHVECRRCIEIRTNDDPKAVR